MTFDQIPTVLVDATTAVEDKTFWENAGFDPVAIFSAALDTLRGNSRGASTITQQLVRNVLLDRDLVQDPDRTAERKLKEIIQSIRLTEAFPGETGKQQIITAYLNQNYYGNQTYGVKAAAESTSASTSRRSPRPRPRSWPGCRSRHRTTTSSATPSSSALTVARRRRLPAGKSQLIVPPTRPSSSAANRSSICSRRGRTPMSGDQYSAADFTAAKRRAVVLAQPGSAALDRAPLRMGRP